MRIKNIELTNFKRFTHLIIDSIPESAKLVVLVGPNGSGKTSFFEAINQFHIYFGYRNIGDYNYLSKIHDKINYDEWTRILQKTINIDFHDFECNKNSSNNNIKGHFYFRTAYRNEPYFQVNSMTKQNDPTQYIRLSTLIQNDQTVSSNYQRLVTNTISGVFNSSNDTKNVFELRNELIGTIQNAISHIFDDLQFTSIGNPLENGNFYFTKGETKNFNYQNLSAGEKSAFDLILDIVVQSKYYNNAIYCIDEPELHMHTKLQGKVLREIYSLIPRQSQLWISTHSIGMLQEAEEIEKEQPGTVVFLDFGNRNFDTDEIIRPTKIRTSVRNKFYELAFGDFSKLILPKTIVFCEGNPNGRTRKDFDKLIYSKIFENTYPEAFFISCGECNKIESIEKNSGEIINTLLKNTKIIKIIDRDDRSDQEIEELASKGIKVLNKRNIESYLLDDSVIKKLCDNVGKPEKYEECINKKKEALDSSINRGNPTNDYKSAKGEIYNSLKKILQLTQCGNNADSFIRDTLAPLISSDMEIYKELEKNIFG